MTKKKAKFNIVDLIVILVVILAAGYGVYAIAGSLGDGGETVSVEYVIESDVIRKDVVMSVKAGDSVYAEDGTYMGRVKYCEVVKATKEGVDPHGNVVVTETEDYTLLLTIDASAVSKKNGYSVSDYRIAMGEGYSLRCPSLWFKGTCISVKASQPAS